MSNVENDLNADKIGKNPASENPDVAGYGADQVTQQAGGDASQDHRTRTPLTYNGL